MPEAQAVQYEADLSNLDARVGEAMRRMSSLSVLLGESAKARGLEGFTKGEDDGTGGFTLATPLGPVDVRLGYVVHEHDLCPVALYSRKEGAGEAAKAVPLGMTKLLRGNALWLGMDGQPLPVGTYGHRDIQTGLKILQQVATAQVRSLAAEAAAYE